MSLHAELDAVRLHTALADLSHVAVVRVVGEDAFDALDHVCPADLYLRDGQMLHTLLLADQGSPVADLYVCRDDEDFLLLAEGMDAPTLMAWLRDAWPADLAPDVVDLSESHRLLSVAGPWAWELMAELVGAGVVGLPYLTLFHEPHWTCFRAGKTGEFGYDLLVTHDHHDALRARLLELGVAFGMREVGLEALDQCALENWFFNIRREGRAGVTPLELQLQWRVSADKDYPGAAALAARRKDGIRQRLTTVVSSAPFQMGDPVWHGDEPIGTLVNAGDSPHRGDRVGLALLDAAHAHAGLHAYHVEVAGARHPLHTASPPVLHNRSLFVQPQKHSYRTRHEHTFPPLAEETT